MTFIFPENNINARQQKRKIIKIQKTETFVNIFKFYTTKNQKNHKTKRPKISYR